MDSLGQRENNKIMVVGYQIYDLYAPCFTEALKQMGKSDILLFPIDIECGKGSVRKFIKRFEDHYTVGGFTLAINRKLISAAKEYQPDMVFFYTSRNIFASTIKKIRDLGCLIITYNNDNPFSKYYPWYFWRHYIKSLKYTDLAYTFRTSNFDDCIKNGAKRVELLRAYYRNSVNYYIPNPDAPEYVPEVVFLGHYEDDNRIDYINYIASCGIEVGVSDHAYEKYDVCNKKIHCQKYARTHYNLELNSAKIALVFLSKINKDTYTNRCFEIPATKTMMLSEYTDDLATMYDEGHEIVFFRSKEDLLSKIRYYLSHEDERTRIAVAGYARLKKDGHEVKDRAKQVIDKYEEIKSTYGMMQ